MTPQEFVHKWKKATLSERSAAQQHFLDICNLIGHPTPADLDSTGESFTFEKGTDKTTSKKGFADVWKRGFFGWEYKENHANLDKVVPNVYAQTHGIAKMGCLERSLPLNTDRARNQSR